MGRGGDEAKSDCCCVPSCCGAAAAPKAEQIGAPKDAKEMPKGTPDGGKTSVEPIPAGEPQNKVPF
jgi:hypothetical protein